MDSRILSPRISDGLVNMDKEVECSNFQIHWRHLNYTVTNSLATRISKKLQGFNNIPKSRTILENVSGTVSSGELVAFMGPSGAGKSTLMECVVGKRVRGKTGETFISGDNLENIRVAFIAQKNDFLTQLTVRETILFAARIQISTKAKNGDVDPLFDDNGNLIITKPASDEYCRIITESIICDLGLQKCANNRVSSCSGGEKKRLAVAQEIVGRPRILVLDEPTSGLDSASCFQIIDLLRKLCESKMKITVLASIHQPSYKVLCLFHKLFVLSSKGDIIYDNSPVHLADELNKYNLRSNFNPADLIIEVAAGEHGKDVLSDMVSDHKHEHFEAYQNSKPLSELNKMNSFPDFTHSWILFKKNNLVTIRDPVVFGARVVSSLSVAFFLTSVFGSDIGKYGGCPPKFNADFEPSQLAEIGNEIEAELKATYSNAGNAFFAVLMGVFNAMLSTSLGFPFEMLVFKTEKYNLWYSDRAFFFGKTLSEIPIQIMFVIIYWPLQHTLQNQTPDLWRIAAICVVLLLVQLIAQSFGYVVGSLFMNNVAASMFLGTSIFLLPFMLLSGLYIKVKNLSPVFTLLSFSSYTRFAIEATFVSLYGYGVCGTAKSDLKEGREAFIVWFSAMLGIYGTDETSALNGTDYAMGTPSEKFVEELIDTIAGDFISNKNEVRSSVMNTFELEDWYVMRALIVLVIYMIIMRFVSFTVIKLMTRSAD